MFSEIDPQVADYNCLVTFYNLIILNTSLLGNLQSVNLYHTIRHTLD